MLQNDAGHIFEVGDTVWFCWNTGRAQKGKIVSVNTKNDRAKIEYTWDSIKKTTTRHVEKMSLDPPCKKKPAKPKKR